ncbi:unnamed protein product [Lupinus luteus]|uniref:Uncharacterized protein n=1 Tax=Lupinus luteus TaxID=3873 RepID=A0AAV1X040_LUPLU
MHLHCTKDMLIVDLNILMYKTLTSFIMCICLILFQVALGVVGSYSILCLFFCLFYVYEQVSCRCALDIH